MLSAERESGDYDSDKGIYCGYAGSGQRVSDGGVSRVPPI